MTIHIDELHSEVVSAAAGASQAGDGRADPPWVVQERWREARRTEDDTAARVCAVGFDD